MAASSPAGVGTGSANTGPDLRRQFAISIEKKKALADFPGDPAKLQELNEMLALLCKCEPDVPVKTDPVLNAAIELNWANALRRYDAAFGEISPTQVQKSSARIEMYLAERTGAPRPPAEVANLMIRLDMSMDMRNAIGHRANVILRHVDEAAFDQSAEMRRSKAPLNLKQMTDKFIPGHVAESLYDKLSVVSEESNAALRAAIVLLTGSGTCDFYASLLTLRAVQICNELHTHFKSIKLTMADSPTIFTKVSHPIGNNTWADKQLRHRNLIAFVETHDGQNFTISLDPWNETNMPILLTEARLNEEGKLDFIPTFHHDCKSSPLLSGWISKSVILRIMQKANDLLPTVVQDPATITLICRDLLSFVSIDPDDFYSLSNAAFGVFTDRWGTIEAQKLFDSVRYTRRPSISPEERWPITEWIKDQIKRT